MEPWALGCGLVHRVPCLLAVCGRMTARANAQFYAAPTLHGDFLEEVDIGKKTTQA